jgi:hypothetical protein
MGEAVTGSEDGKSILHLWLNVLGWQVDVRRKGDRLVGVARHITADGNSVRVGGTAATRDELMFKLFEAALQLVESGTNQRSLLAA